MKLRFGSAQTLLFNNTKQLFNNILRWWTRNREIKFYKNVMMMMMMMMMMVMATIWM